MIVHASVPVTLIGGGQLGTEDLSVALTLAPRLVAADGGAAAALAAGHWPEAVIGDMDSLSARDQARLADRIHRVTEQETTDFDKALRSIAAPLVLAAGFTGGRLDHALAVLHVLLRHPDRPCIVIGPQDVTCLCPPRLTLPLPAGSPASLFPMAQVRVASTGLEWPTAGLVLAPGGRIGTSNTALGPVTLAPDAPCLLVILPRVALPLLARAVLDAPLWPSGAAPSPPEGERGVGG